MKGWPPGVWGCRLRSSGEVVSIVRTEAEAHHICRECRVFTIDEIARPPETEIFIRKVRFKSVGRIGSVILRYDPATGQYSDPAEDGESAEGLWWRREEGT